MLGSFPSSGAEAATRLQLRLMATTDLHLHLGGYDYLADAPHPTTGLAATTALARRLRREAPNALLFDCGDVLQGTPMGDMLASRRFTPERPHPMIAAMNAAGYDAATLGNHDFDYGLDFLLNAVRRARYPLVLANLAARLGARPEEDETLLPPFAVLRRRMSDPGGRWHDLAIGVIGFIPPQVTVWNRRRLGGGVKARDIVEAAEAWVPRLREAGADLVVALSHSGIAAEPHAPGMENAALALAAVEGIDVIIAGHQHMVFPPAHRVAAEPVAGVDALAGTLHGKPAAMAGAQGSHLAVIDLLLESVSKGWRIAGHRSLAMPVPPARAGAAADDIIEATAEAHVATLAHVRQPVGRTTAPLTTHFALLGHAPAVRLLAAAQRWHARDRLAGSPLAELPLLSAAAPARAGGRGGPENYTDIPAGTLTLRHLADICPFPNSVTVLQITGAELRGWLERAAEIFAPFAPGREAQLLARPDAPPYDFDMIEGVNYEIDLGREAGTGRIVNLTWQGRPVSDDMEFLVVTNSYRAAGGGNFPGTGGEPIFESEETSLQILHRYVETMGTVTPPSAPLWRFRPLGGTELRFDTGPGALAHLPALEGLDIAPEGETPQGFLRFRLRL